MPEQEQQRAFLIVGLLCELRYKGRLSEDEIAAKLDFGSAEAMRIQLKNWGLPDWLTGDAPKSSEPDKPTRCLETLRDGQERIERLERDKDELLNSYAKRAPKALEGLSPEERHQLYRLLQLAVVVSPDRSLEVSGASGAEFVQSETVPR